MLSKKLISLSGVGDRNRDILSIGAVPRMKSQLKSHARIVFHFIQEADAVEMFGCGHG